MREVERVCGRLRRSQSRRRVAVRAEVPWAPSPPRGLEHKPAYLKVIAASAKRAAVAGRDAALTAVPYWVGRERQRPGVNKSGRMPTVYLPYNDHLSLSGLLPTIESAKYLIAPFELCFYIYREHN